MAIQIQCPNPACKAGASVDDRLGGKSVKCKRCGTAFVARPTADARRSDTRPASTGDDPFPTLPAGFGRYRVLKLLGRGGMGAVYLAEDTELGRKVALKMPSFGPGAPPTRVDRFLREARAAAALHHPHICTIFDVGREGGRPFLTMAYVEGRPLADAIDLDRPMPERQAATLARQIALALAHAHDRGVVHRDLKPANVMLTAGGDPVVMDFGLAKRLAEEDTEAKLTREGAVIGTPSYMAPEQVRGESAAIGPRTDVYALGAMLYELLTGRTPFEGPVGVILANVLTGKVPAVADVRRDVDPRVDAICRKAMAKDPADRFPSMAALAGALADYLNAPPVSPALPPTVTEARVGPPPLPPTVTREAKPPSFDLKVVEATKPRAARRRVALPRRWGLWAGIGAMVLAAVVVVVVLLTVRTRYGEVVIELTDPAAKVEVKVDGERIDLAGLDRPISLKAGEHGLTVTGEDYKAEYPRSFTVKKGEREVVKVTLTPVAGVAKGGGPAGDDARPTSGQPGRVPDGLPAKEREARDKAIAWLKGDQTKWGGEMGDWERVSAAEVPAGGATALALLALLENGVGPDDPVVARGLAYLRSVEPQRVYVVALQTQVYCAAGRPGDADRIKANVRWLEKAAAYDGPDLLGWSYAAAPNGRADVSNTRYAVAGLAAANRAGYLVTELGLWDKVKGLFARTQRPGGGWRYTETHGEADAPPTHTMTASGALCMALAAQAMPPADAETDPAFAAAISWLAERFEFDRKNTYYHLDVLAALGRARGTRLLGAGASARDWFKEGSDSLLWAQRSDGRFVGEGAEANPVIATAFALRFLASRPAAGPRAAADEFGSLFNGRDLTGWTVAKGEDIQWQAKDGELVGFRDAGQSDGWLLTDRDYGPFVLRFAFRMRAGANASSGIMFGLSPADSEFLPIKLMDDGDRSDLAKESDNVTGAFWARGKDGGKVMLAPKRRAPLNPAGDWNAAELTVDGKTATLAINDKVVQTFDLAEYAALVGDNPPLTRARGRIGFQAHTSIVRFRNIRLKALDGQPPAAKAPPGKPELVALTELPGGQNKSGPWLSADGRSLYWADKQGSEHRIWRTDRPGPGQPFANPREQFTGHDLTVSADMTEVILVDHDPAAGENKFALFAGKKARPTDVVFGSWRKLTELADYGFVAAPCLSSDGLTLYAEQFGDKTLPPNVRFRRADRTAAWGKAEAVPITGLEKGTLRFPFVSPDGRYLFGNNDVSPSGMVMLTSSDGGKTFGSPRAVEVPGGAVKGKFPRYAPESNELFFGDIASGGKMADLYVIRNFDPARDTRPLK